MKKWKGLLGLLFLLGSCVDPYDPPIHEKLTDLLVVEGTITGAGFQTAIRLSRTVGVQQDETDIRMETGARVQVESDNGALLELQEFEDGVYTTNMELNSDVSYRLLIKTTDGMEYRSEFAPVLTSPPIDSISWKQEDNYDLTIYVNTHDPQNNTWYYCWEYDEDWEITAWLRSEYEWDGSQMVPRDEQVNNINNCWDTNVSTQILVGNSTQLTQDVIHLFPIRNYKRSDRSLSYLYRIRVRQYALGNTAYQYWESMKKNTEGTNDLFSPQPSDIAGNIQCTTDPQIPVIGFVEAVIPSVAERYISFSELKGWSYDLPWQCREEYPSVPPDPNPLFKLVGINDSETISDLLDQGFLIISQYDERRILMLPRLCGDCRVYASKNKPVDWINDHH